MEKILVIEDDRFASEMIKKTLAANDFSSQACQDYKTASETLLHEVFFAAVMNMHLHDSDWQKTTALLKEYNLPIIIFSSGRYDSVLREHVLEKRIIDFIEKDDPSSLQHMAQVLVRLRKNSRLKVLVADDSALALNQAKSILINAKFQTLTASDGIEALDVLEMNPDISVVLTDYIMPRMNGLELLKRIRQRFDGNSLSVIAVSDLTDKEGISGFLKSGANDYILKPYSNDELYCRVVNNAELVESYHEVSRLNQEKNYFLGMAAHDIRGPLGSVSGLCRQVIENSGYEGDAIELFRIIMDTSDDILSMMEGLLDISSIESRSFSLKPVIFSLSDLVQQRLERIFFSSAKMKGINLSYTYEEQLEFLFDKTRISQVVDNLISNAIKFTPENGEVKIALRHQDNRVIFSVEDTGPGLSEEDMEKVFNEFTTLSAGATKGEKTVGLGLSICNRIIRLHKGEIGVKRGRSGGAEFYFMLPADTAPAG